MHRHLQSLLLVLLTLATLPWLTATPALAAVPALTTKRSSSCSWDRPGHNPFVGDLVASLDRYTDIPEATRARLKQRMAARDYDDLVSIKRDSISGKKSYDPRIRDMHFGENSMCREVTRAKWTPQMEERGLVYCEGSHCILVPTVCRNVSRIDAAPGAVAAGPDELVFDPPGAGVPPAATPAAPLAGAAAPDSFAGGLPSTATPLGLGGEPIGATPLGGSPLSAAPGSALPGISPLTPFVPSSGPGNVVPLVAVPAPVPEPSTWALLLAGVLVVGGAGRRRLQSRRS